MSDKNATLSRRALLQATSLGALNWNTRAGTLGKPQSEQPKLEDRNENRTLPRRRLGRTNMRVTTIGSGGAGITSPEILYRAIEKGVNYLDTAPAYGNSEEVFGEVMQTARHQVFLATKWAVQGDWTVDRCLESLHRSLKRLKTDHIDLLQLHSVDTGPGLKGTPRDGYRRIDNPHLHTAMDKARQAGKVLYFGVTSHDPRRSDLLQYAIDTGRFDTIMVAFNALTFPTSGMPKLLAHARLNDIGVIGMRASGGDYPLRLPHVDPLSIQLAWMLTQDIHTVVNSETAYSEDSQDACLAAARLKLP